MQRPELCVLKKTSLVAQNKIVSFKYLSIVIAHFFLSRNMFYRRCEIKTKDIFASDKHNLGTVRRVVLFNVFLLILLTYWSVWRMRSQWCHTGLTWRHSYWHSWSSTFTAMQHLVIPKQRNIHQTRIRSVENCSCFPPTSPKKRHFLRKT